MATEHSEPITTTRAEIDTSAPFESVKEAANRFGGMGSWKPVSHKLSEHDEETVDIGKLEEQAAQLERDLISKERETLDVLKELETTKNIVEELKSKLQKEINAALNNNNDESLMINEKGGLDNCPSAAPGFILLELKQAKLNLTRTTSNLADIRATVDLYKKKIEKERASLEKTRQRWSSNTSNISSLEDELNQTRRKLEVVQDSSHDPLNLTLELQKLSSETEQFKKVGESVRLEVLKAMSEIELTKTRIKTVELRLIAAKKMKEAARASEAMALAEIKSLSKSNSGKKSEDVITLTFKEYETLISKSREAEQICKNRAVDAMVRVDEANVSRAEILKRVEEATEEVKISKKVLEEVLSRVEVAKRGKVEVEEALRAWRCEHVHKRRSVQNGTKFKNSTKESRLVDVNGLSLVGDELEFKPVLKPTLSIGQILSRKLLLTEECEKSRGEFVHKRKVSLRQMLGKSNDADDLRYGSKTRKENKEGRAKRKKFGFGRISLLVTKQSKKKKMKQAANSLSV